MADIRQPARLTEAVAQLLGRAPMLRVVLAFAAGIGCAELFPTVGLLLPALLALMAAGVAAVGASGRVRWLTPAFLPFLWLLFMDLGFLTATYHRTTPTDGLPASGWCVADREPALFSVRLADTPRQAPRTYKVAARVEAVYDGAVWQEADCPILLYLHKDSSAAALQYGDRLVIHARPQQPDSSINPYQFDYRRYLLRKGIAWHCYVAQEGWNRQPDSLASHRGLLAWSKRVQRHLVQRLQATTLSQQYKGMAAALLLGWRDDLEPSTLLHFRQAGIMHLLCVSGLHVGIVAWLAGLLFLFMGKLRWQRVLKGSVQLLAIWGFTFVTGMAPSTLRAAVMFSLLRIGYMAQQRPLALNNLCTSALLLLFVNPGLLFDVGFQFSYTAVVGILALQDPLRSLVKLPFEKRWTAPVRYVWKLVCLTLSAQLFCMPLQLYYFHEVYTWFIIANLLIVPFAGLLLATVLAVVLLPQASGLGHAAVWLAGQEFHAADGLAAWVGGLPCAVLDNLYCSPFMFVLLAVALLLVTLFLRSRLRWPLPVAAAVLMVAAICLTVVNTKAANRHEVVVYKADWHLAVECFDGRHSYLVCDSVVARNPEEIRFHREGMVNHCRTLSTTVLPVDTVFNDGRCALQSGILCFGEERIDLSLKQRRSRR